MDVREATGVVFNTTAIRFSRQVFGIPHNCGRFPGLDHQAVTSRGSSGGHGFPTLHLNTAHFCGWSGLKRDTRQQKSTFVAKRILFPQKNGTVWNPGRVSHETVGCKAQFAN